MTGSPGDATALFLETREMFATTIDLEATELDEIASDPDNELLVTVARRMRFKREDPESPLKVLLLYDVVIVCYSDLEG